MEKKRLKVQSEEAYFLGLNKDDERVYLRLPSFDCGWYWGAGYISTYSGTVNTERNFSMHTHFKGYIIGQQEEYNHDKGCFVKTDYTHHLNEVLKETTLSDSESWALSELINSMEILKGTSGFYHRGGSHMAENPIKNNLKNDDEYKRINSVLLPKIFQEIDRLLKGDNDSGRMEEYFAKQFKTTN